MELWLSQFAVASAEIFILVMVAVVMMVDLILSHEHRWITYGLSQATLVVAAILTWQHWNQPAQTVFDGQYVMDNFAVLTKEFVYLMGFGVFIYSRLYLDEHRILKGEFYLLGLLSLTGALVLISGASMLTLYLGLELLSLPLYAMVSMRRDCAVSSEAAMKYFVLGSLASGVFLYGLSLIYGMTHTIMLAQIMGQIPGAMVNQPVMIFAMVLLVAAIAFKLGAVPFHMWVPDVYEGAPTAVTAFVGSIPKLAAFALMIRLVFDALVQMMHQWMGLLTILAILSLIIGNILAVVQTNLKRLLGYSTIANVGFILLGLATGTLDGLHAALFYTLVYVLTAVAGFGILIILSRRGQEYENLADLRGLNYRNSWLTLMLMLVLLSLAGIPPLVGFTAKLMIIRNLVNAQEYYLAGFALLMAVIGSYYYLKVIVAMYFEEPEVTEKPLVSVDGTLALTVNSLLLLVLGFMPAVLLSLVLQVG